MWTREELKTSAKTVLKRNYWWGFLAFLIYYAISVGASGLFGFVKVPYLGIAVSFFVALPLFVGLYKYFLYMRQDRTDVSELFYAFKGDGYLSIVGSMAWMTLWTALWTLLFIVPGIIKGISYSMTPFILADNPKIGYKRAIKLSMAMTDGQKGSIFVLYLSFILWFLGCCATAGIGFFFLAPYFTSTYTELYIRLRANAINNGFCKAEELNIQ
jgi:uncharacterized membrane protein